MVLEVQSLSKSFVKSGEPFAALSNVSFHLAEGKSLGLIGGNGSGKSTLLKLISGVLSPSAGAIRIRGRVASILDIGTGFHNELTGRENVFLQGQLLGIRKQEMRKRFDEIVAFSGVEEFIDTPVKHYSSGMYLRLAFSVMSHVQVDLMLVDEVISVGDADFQLKSRSKMMELSRLGCSFVIASHQMNELLMMADDGILLEKGRLIEQGNISLVVGRYIAENLKYHMNSMEHNNLLLHRFTDSEVELSLPYIKLVSLQVQNSRSDCNPLITDEPVRITVAYQHLQHNSSIDFVIKLTDLYGSTIFETSSVSDDRVAAITDGISYLTCTVPANLFNTGIVKLWLTVMADKHKQVEQYKDLITIIFELSKATGKFERLFEGPIQSQGVWSTSTQL